MADENHDELISRFSELTGASAEEAQQYLMANRWDLSSAAAEYYTSQEEEPHGSSQSRSILDELEQSAPAAEPEAPYTGPRTLDGRPAPQSIPTVGSSSRAAPPPRRGGVATLGSIAQAPSAHGHGHAHDDDDDSDDDDDMAEEPRDLFAGGEKSGLAVQDPTGRSNDPRKVVNDILKKARANAARPGGEPSSSAPPSRFRGGGQTLGGDDAPSQVIPDPHAAAPEVGQTQTRILHLWEDGFSIEDGPLRRFDDAQNAADLAMIRQGQAPLHLMGVRADQPVDVQLIKHDDKYKAPPKVYKPFSGSGQRLGSPTPGGSGITTQPQATLRPASTPAPVVDIDEAQPTLALRLQLANGTRLPARFNTTQTIGDVYAFINRAVPDVDERPWVLATTFPNKEHTDHSLVLGEMAEFKRGGTAVQKWT